MDVLFKREEGGGSCLKSTSLNCFLFFHLFFSFLRRDISMTWNYCTLFHIYNICTFQMGWFYELHLRLLCVAIKSEWIFISKRFDYNCFKNVKHSVGFQRVFILLISIINWRLSSILIQWNENFFFSFLNIHPRVIYDWATVFIVTTQSHFNIFCWMGSKIIKLITIHEFHIL